MEKQFRICYPGIISYSYFQLQKNYWLKLGRIIILKSPMKQPAGFGHTAQLCILWYPNIAMENPLQKIGHAVTH